MAEKRLPGIVLAGGVLVALALAAMVYNFEADPPPVPGTEVPPVQRPNVLIVLWDTVRADHLSLYGHEVETTPHLERFAEGARVFDNAVSPGMWTVPSHGSIFTGLPPSAHGATFEWRWLDHHHTTLAEYFKEHGYKTFAFSANPNLSKRGANLLQGFDVVQTSWGPRWWPMIRQVTRRKLLPRDSSTEISPAYTGDRPGNGYYNGAPATARALFRWLDNQDDGRPWLAYLNYMEAHKPRVPDLVHRRQVMDEPAHELALRTDMTFLNQLAYGYGQTTFTQEEIEATRGVYDACLHELDDWTDRLFKNLEKRGILDDTIVVLTSDHGESLGEHQRYGHRYGVYQTLLHVPLVLHYPKKVPAGRDYNPVSTQDLFATLTDLAELPPSPTALDSRSLLGKPRDSVFSEVLSFDTAGLDLVRRFHPAIAATGWEKTFRTVRDGNHKLILDQHDHAELYEVEYDPGETRDLAVEKPELVERLRSRIATWERTRPQYDPGKRTAADKPVVSRKEKGMLEVLGYVVDDEDLEDEVTP